MRSAFVVSSYVCLVLSLFFVSFYYLFIAKSSSPIGYVRFSEGHFNCTPGSLTPDEARVVGFLADVLFLSPLVVDNYELVFATSDSSAPKTIGRLLILRVESSPSGDYLTFFSLHSAWAVQKMALRTVELGEGVTALSPANSTLFALRWRNGRLLKCLGLSVGNTSEKRVIPESYVANLVRFRNFVQRYGASPFLFGGTLLGWYRECSIIRDTTDVDFAMRIDDLKPGMLDDMKLKRKDFKLYWILGKKDDSLEISVYSDKVKIDLFFLYRGNETDWVGGMVVPERRKLRWVYPHIEQFCSADLLGHLFTVPCNVEGVIEADYGKDWRVPHRTDDFLWQSSHQNVYNAGYWTAVEWKSVYHVM